MKNFRTPLRFYSWCSTRGAHGNLARNISREEELCLALEYVSGTIDYFIEENKNDGVVEKRFVLPTEILFYKVQKFFKEEVKKYDILELDSLMMSEGTTIEKSHFVCREDNIYPLYNVSLLIDLYDIWENKNIGVQGVQTR